MKTYEIIIEGGRERESTLKKRMPTFNSFTLKMFRSTHQKNNDLVDNIM